MRLSIKDEFFTKLGQDTFQEPFNLARFARPSEEQVNIMPVAKSSTARMSTAKPGLNPGGQFLNLSRLQCEL